MSNLPRDVTEEVLSRLPVTSLRGARSTCKKWNTLTKDESFFKKHLLEAAKKKQRKEVQVVMLLEHKVYLMSVDLINPSPSIERIGKLVSLDDDDAAADGVGISNIFHCDGLLLCVTKEIMNSGLVVWNPYSGQTKWIEPRNSYHRFDRYAIGYEKNDKNLLRSHKVLRFVDAYNWSVKRRVCEFGIYNLNSNSWKVIDVNPDWSIGFYQRGVSLKGNTYWFAQEKVPTVQGPAISDLPDFLLCFDFTRERFGPRLPLPFHSFEDIVTLSSVREEQLAVLFQKSGAPAYPLKIWISSKIEPNAVSWNKLFLDVDMKPLTGFQFLDYGGSFFLDEKEEVAVVLDKDRDTFSPTRNIAYIIGKNGYFKQVDLGGSAKADCWPLVCSYVPSSVQIKQPAPLGKQRNTP